MTLRHCFKVRSLVVAAVLITGLGLVNHAKGQTRPYLVDLNSFLDASMANAGWVLERAYDINDNGWIVGDARIGQSGENHAFLLAPIPEPETYALMLAGLVLVGFIARPAGRQKIPG